MQTLDRDNENEKPYKGNNNMPIAFKGGSKPPHAAGHSGHMNKQEFAYGAPGGEDQASQQ